MGTSISMTLAKEVQDECRRVLETGNNPRITCEDKEHQQYVEDLLAGKYVHREKNLNKQDRYDLVEQLIFWAKRVNEAGGGQIKIGCWDKQYVDLLKRHADKDYDQRRREERKAFYKWKRMNR